MFLEKDSNVHVLEGKDVINVVKEIVFEWQGTSEGDILSYIVGIGEVEEVLLFCDAYLFSNLILENMKRDIVIKDTDVPINGGWWWNKGFYVDPSTDTTYPVLLVNDGVVWNVFVFIKNIC